MNQQLAALAAGELGRLGNDPVTHVLIKNGSGKPDRPHMVVVTLGRADQFDFIVNQCTSNTTVRETIPLDQGDPLIGMCITNEQLSFLVPPCPFVNFIEVADVGSAKVELARQKLGDLGLLQRKTGRHRPE